MKRKDDVEKSKGQDAVTKMFHEEKDNVAGQKANEKTFDDAKIRR